MSHFGLALVGRGELIEMVSVWTEKFFSGPNKVSDGAAFCKPNRGRLAAVDSAIKFNALSEICAHRECGWLGGNCSTRTCCDKGEGEWR